MKLTKEQKKKLIEYQIALEEAEAKARRKNLKKKLELEKAKFLYGD